MDSDAQSLYELSLEELLETRVITSSKRLEAVDQAPNTIYVVTAEEIRRRGLHTLRELLRTIPGFGVFHKDIEFAAQVRGIAPNENAKIAFLINGTNIAQGQEASLLNGPIDLSIAERVEVIVGPGSVLYGADSVLATVNIITKTPERSEVHVAFGNILAEATGVFSRQEATDRYVTATFTAMRKNGWDAWPTPEDHGGPGQPVLTGNTATGQVDPSYFLTVTGRLGEWSVQATSRNLTFPDLKHAVSEPAGSDGERYERSSTIGFRHDHDWTGVVSTNLDVSYSDKRQVRVFTGTDPVVQGESSYDLAQGTYRVEYAVQHEVDRNFLQLGVQGRMDQNRSNYIFYWAPEDPTEPPGSTNQIRQLVDNRDTFGIGAYASDAFRVSDWLELVGAARVDKDSSLGIEKTYFNPRGAAVFDLADAWTSKLIYNSATRVPSPWEGPLNEVWGLGAPGAPAGTDVNPPALRPEVLTAFEWQNIVRVGATRIALTGYRQRLRDFIAWGGPFTNIGDIDGYGAELTLQSAPTPTLKVWANGAYSHSIFDLTATGTSFGNTPTNDQNEMSAAPAFTANAGAEWELRPGVVVSPTIRYFTHQPTYFWSSERWGYTNNRYYFDLAVTASDVVVDGLDVSVAGFNLADNTQPVAAQYLQGRYNELGIELVGQLSYRF